MREYIHVENARVHNLKGVTLDIPRERLVVFTGVSGSGKSSLVFDTLHTEAQRQLIETFSSFARRRLPKLSRPDVDAIQNLSTSIVIDQKRMGRTLRSTVGTATEVYTYLRMLYSRCGDSPDLASFHFSFNHPAGMCPVCKGLGQRIRIDTSLLLDPSKSIRDGGITHPDYKLGGWNWREIMGMGLFDVEKPLGHFTPEELERLFFAEAIPIEKQHGGGIYSKNWYGIASKLERLYQNKGEDEYSDVREDVFRRYLRQTTCDACHGLRLNPTVGAVRVAGVAINDAVQMELTDLDGWLAGLDDPVSVPLVRKMRSTLGHLIQIGVDYLSLNRSVSTLSGGESQRVKMARQLDCDLTGLMYVLDEPSIGLHAKDVGSLVGMLRRLRDQGNSVLVVEHDPGIILAADHVVEVGPGPGRAGGEICFQGNLQQFASADSVTARWIRDRIDTDGRPRRSWSKVWEVRNARMHNLQGLDVDIPQGVLVCVTGVAGSGKSTLVHQVFSKQVPDAVVVDQSPIGRSSRSNAATFVGLFDPIRKLFAKATGKSAAHFSFNSEGACAECKGAGSISVEMSFLDDVRIECPVCLGRRYTDEVLSLRWKGLNIAEVLEMTAQEARGVFTHKGLREPLQLLCDVGLEYLTLGQPLSTLSGGECQRLKLAQEMGKSGHVYILDEPTTGLHLADTKRLLDLLHRLVDDGNSVVVVEHNLDVIAQADWILDLGPEGGRRGGQLVAQGTPEQLALCGQSHTGRYLKSRQAPDSPPLSTSVDRASH